MDDATRDEIRYEVDSHYELVLAKIEATIERIYNRLLIVIFSAVGLGVAFLSFLIRWP